MATLAWGDLLIMVGVAFVSLVVIALMPTYRKGTVMSTTTRPTQPPESSPTGSDQEAGLNPPAARPPTK